MRSHSRESGTASIALIANRSLGDRYFALNSAHGYDQANLHAIPRLEHTNIAPYTTTRRDKLLILAGHYMAI